MKEASKRHTVAVLVENRFGVLVRVAGLFSARGYNIESLSVGETQEPGVSRITIVTTGDDLIVEKITSSFTGLSTSSRLSISPMSLLSIGRWL